MGCACSGQHGAEADDERALCPLTFYLSGSGMDNLDAEAVCPAWMIPPTDLKRPTMVVREADHEMEYRGLKLRYKLHYLGLSEDEADLTPVLVKVIDGHPYMVLTRGHLQGT